jgi:patatin-like phospholipase/acyl hydrolase
MSSRGVDDNVRSFRILSLDGGGIRGAFTAGFLAGIEERIGQPVGQYFDLVAGTSTGGIIAAAVAFGEPASKIEEFYLEHGPRIFARPWEKPIRWYKQPCRWVGRLYPKAVDRTFYNRFGVDRHWVHNSKYIADELKGALTEVFADKKLGHARNRLVIPSVNAISGQPKVFKTSHLSHLFTDHKYKIVDVLLATAAAPTYFPAAVLESEPGSAYVDGGLWANNPSVVALVESMMISERCRRADIDPVFSLETTLMLSVGTGKPAVSSNPPGTKAGIFWWMANKLLDLSSLAQSKGVDFQARHILSDRHHRIEFDLAGPEWTMDNASLVGSMVHLGRQRAIAEVENLRAEFFTEAVPRFVPYEPTPAPEKPVAEEIAGEAEKTA